MEDSIEKYLVHDSSSIMDKRMHEIEISRLIKAIQFRGPVLDMGFGHGVVARAVIENFGHCTVVEKSSELVAHARKLFGEQLDVYHSSFEDYFPPTKFGTVLATAILHHVADPLLVLEKIRSWLLPGGTLLVTAPNAQSIHRAIAVARGWETSLESVSATGRKMGVVHTFTSSQLRELIERAGFSIVQHHPSFLKFLPYSEMSLFATPQLRALFDFAGIAPTELHATIVFEAKLNSVE